jgi:hypothetical protein
LYLRAVPDSAKAKKAKAAKAGRSVEEREAHHTGKFPSRYTNLIDTNSMTEAQIAAKKAKAKSG